MKTCKICGKEKSPYILNNRSVCMRCDELVFDVEIECDDDYVSAQQKKAEPTPTSPKIRRVPTVVKK